jgi:hypothetical protein
MKNIFYMLLFVTATSSLLSQPANTGMTFLQLGVGARSVAMGEAGAASATDGTAPYYNPAALSFAEHNDITVMHKSWITDVSTEYFGAAIQGKTIALGFSFNTTNVGNIDIRTQPGEAVGTFNAHDMAITGSASVKAGDAFSIGVSGKFLYEKIFVDEASGYAVDLGGFYQLSNSLALGVSVCNLGSVNELKNDPIELPALLRAGAVYSGTLAERFTYTVNGDLVDVFKESAAHLHVGGEVSFDNVLALRAGYQSGYEAKNFSAGLGVAYGMLRFDYGFVPLLSGLGTSHTFSLSFRI